MRLTDEGRLYLNGCRQALQALDDANALLQAGRNVVGGVRLSATSDFGRRRLLDWLDEFTARYPDVTLSLTASDSTVNQAGRDRPRDPLRGETNDGGLARSGALRGRGIVLNSIWDVADDIRAGRLKVLLPDWRHQSAPLHAIYPGKRYMAPRARAARLSRRTLRARGSRARRPAERVPLTAGAFTPRGRSLADGVARPQPAARPRQHEKL